MMKDRIKQLRKERGLTIRDISEYMGFTTDQAVCKWQRGDSLPSLDNLYALSRLYGTTMEDILIGDDEMSSRFSKRRMKFSSAFSVVLLSSRNFCWIPFLKPCSKYSHKDR